MLPYDDSSRGCGWTFLWELQGEQTDRGRSEGCSQVVRLHQGQRTISRPCPLRIVAPALRTCPIGLHNPEEVVLEENEIVPRRQRLLYYNPMLKSTT
jgi:hypothetical protein